VITARDVEGITDRPYPIDADGTITLPLVGKIRAEGLTVEEFETDLRSRLAIYVKAPVVSVKRAAQPTTTIVAAGAFKSPGVYPLTDRRAVLDVVNAVGGLESNASHTITVTRRPGQNANSLPSATRDPGSGVVVAKINLSRLMENPALGDNILIEPGDVLSAEPAVVFLSGEVQKPGQFELTDRDSISLSELIALGGGVNPGSAPQKAQILRPILNGARRAPIAVDAREVLSGRAEDFRVLPDDIVVIPRGRTKMQTLGKVALVLLPIAVTSAILLSRY
jgi:polysaccharide export outer membrane protein